MVYGVSLDEIRIREVRLAIGKGTRKMIPVDWARSQLDRLFVYDRIHVRVDCTRPPDVPSIRNIHDANLESGRGYLGAKYSGEVIHPTN